MKLKKLIILTSAAAALVVGSSAFADTAISNQTATDTLSVAINNSTLFTVAPGASQPLTTSATQSACGWGIFNHPACELTITDSDGGVNTIQLTLSGTNITAAIQGLDSNINAYFNPPPTNKKPVVVGNSFTFGLTASNTILIGNK